MECSGTRMERGLKAWAWKILFDCLKFFSVYYIFGMVAMYAIIFSVLTIEFVKTGTSSLLMCVDGGEQSIFRIIIALIHGIADSIPFSELFEIFVENGGNIFSGLFDFFAGFFQADKMERAWSEYAGKLVRDLVVATIASLVAFCFSRLNRLLKLFESGAAKFGFIIASVLWFLASYCVAECTLTILEATTDPGLWGVLYFCMFFIAFLLHALFLGGAIKKASSKLARALIVLAVDAIFSVIIAYLLWRLQTYLFGLFDLREIHISVFVFILVAFLLRGVDTLENWILGLATASLPISH